MELRSGKILNGILSAKDVEGEELSMPLPEELVERILAMVPFPQIFKVRALSKSWHARLSSVSSQDDEEKKRLAVSFQKWVSKSSDKWKPFWPILPFDEFLIAYDHTSQQWRRIPFLSALPDIEATKLMPFMHRRHVFHSSIAGAVLLFKCSHLDIMFVLNIFTGSWKQLLAVPEDRRPDISERLVRCSSKDMYKVIGFYTHGDCLRAWVYDSKSGAWRCKKLEVMKYFSVARYDVYLNGVIYVMVHVQQLFWGFLAFDVEGETFNLFQIPRISKRLQVLQNPRLLVCNGTVYTVGTKDSKTLTLLEVDLVRRRLGKVIRGPPAALKFGFLSSKASSDGESLFFQGIRRDRGTLNGKVLAYNVRKDLWSYFALNPISEIWLRSDKPPSFDTSTFQPNINLFLEV